MKKVTLSIVLVSILSGMYIKYNSISSRTQPSINIKNMEALASGEYDNNNHGPLANNMCLDMNNKPCFDNR